MDQSIMIYTSIMGLGRQTYGWTSALSSQAEESGCRSTTITLILNDILDYVLLLISSLQSISQSTDQMRKEKSSNQLRNSAVGGFVTFDSNSDNKKKGTSILPISHY